MKRPLGVTIIAVLLIIAGILGLIFGGLALAAAFTLGHTLDVHHHATTSTVVDTLGVILASIPLILGLLALIFAWGLWALKRWAFWVTVALDVLFLLRYLLEFARHQLVATGIVGIIISVAILIYLFADPNVRAAFFNRG